MEAKALREARERTAVGNDVPMVIRVGATMPRPGEPGAVSFYGNDITDLRLRDESSENDEDKRIRKLQTTPMFCVSRENRILPRFCEFPFSQFSRRFSSPRGICDERLGVAAEGDILTE
jgi:hypothetical protein